MLDAGATVIHVDVMDGHFVPPITMGPLVVEALAEQVHAAGAVVDVHLMIERPERHVQAFADAGADGITLPRRGDPARPLRAGRRPRRGLPRRRGAQPGHAAEAVAAVAGDVDLVLCMTVNPGWGGQSFLRGLARARSSACAPCSARTR